MIYTSYFSNKQLVELKGQYVFIRVSVGSPRFHLSYTISGAVKSIMPDRSFLGLSDSAYRTVYTRKLDQQGPDKIIKELELVTADRPAILLCFCKPEFTDKCHRRIFAEWFEKKTGVVINEL